MIEVTRVAKTYETAAGPVTVLRDLNLRVAAGESLAIVGPSGSGKTTLLNLAAGLLRASEGAVEAAGENLGKLDGAALDRWRGRNVGIVPQKLHLVSSLDVMQNLLLAPFLAELPADRIRARSLLGQLGLEGHAGKKPGQLSHGQAQRVAIARAVMNRPRLLLADEPTSNLDDANCVSSLDVLEAQARDCGATLVVATHDQRVKQRFEKRLEL